MNEHAPDTESDPTSSPVSRTEFPRRNFLKRTLAVAVGGVVSLFPAAVGFVAFFDPLRKRDRSMPGQETPRPSEVPEGFIDVAAADSLPDDGTPQFVRVIADRMDAWTYFPSQPIGSIFLRRQTDGKVIAYNSTCPHAGCAVDFLPGKESFYCPCHNSAFTLEGERSADSPSPRDLDTLETLVHGGRVWVKYENYRSGTAEQTVIS